MITTAITEEALYRYANTVVGVVNSELATIDKRNLFVICGASSCNGHITLCFSFSKSRWSDPIFIAGLHLYEPPLEYENMLDVVCEDADSIFFNFVMVLLIILSFTDAWLSICYYTLSFLSVTG